MTFKRKSVEWAAFSMLFSCLTAAAIAEENKSPSLLILPAEVQDGTQTSSAETSVSFEYTGSIIVAKTEEALLLPDFYVANAPVPDPKPESSYSLEEKQAAVPARPLNTAPATSARLKKIGSKTGQKVVKVAAREPSRRITRPMPTIIGAFR